MQLKAPVKKVQTIALVGVCALVLGGCSLGIDAAQLAAGSREPGASTTDASGVASAPADAAPVDAVPADVAPPDAGLADGGSGSAGGSYLPPLGTYDPATSDLPPFDPCTEIPAEAFAEVGFPELYSTETYEALGKVCDYSGQSPDGTPAMLSISLSTYDTEVVRALNYHESSYNIPTVGKTISGFQRQESDGSICEFLIPTVRGTLSLIYNTGQPKNDGSYSCDRGAEVAKHLIIS